VDLAAEEEEVVLGDEVEVIVEALHPEAEEVEVVLVIVAEDEEVEVVLVIVAEDEEEVVVPQEAGVVEDGEEPRSLLSLTDMKEYSSAVEDARMFC